MPTSTSSARDSLRSASVSVPMPRMASGRNDRRRSTRRRALTALVKGHLLPRPDPVTSSAIGG